MLRLATAAGDGRVDAALDALRGAPRLRLAANVLLANDVVLFSLMIVQPALGPTIVAIAAANAAAALAPRGARRARGRPRARGRGAPGGLNGNPCPGRPRGRVRHAARPRNSRDSGGMPVGTAVAAPEGMSANVTTVAYLDPASPGTRVLLGLVLLVAALLLIGADWARHEAAVARCTQSGAAFDTALGRCEAAPALAIADRAP